MIAVPSATQKIACGDDARNSRAGSAGWKKRTVNTYRIIKQPKKLWTTISSRIAAFPGRKGSGKAEDEDLYQAQG